MNLNNQYIGHWMILCHVLFGWRNEEGCVSERILIFNIKIYERIIMSYYYNCHMCNNMTISTSFITWWFLYMMISVCYYLLLNDLKKNYYILYITNKIVIIREDNCVNKYDNWCPVKAKSDNLKFSTYIFIL